MFVSEMHTSNFYFFIQNLLAPHVGGFGLDRPFQNDKGDDENLRNFAWLYFE